MQPQNQIYLGGIQIAYGEVEVRKDQTTDNAICLSASNYARSDISFAKQLVSRDLRFLKIVSKTVLKVILHVPQ